MQTARGVRFSALVPAAVPALMLALICIPFRYEVTLTEPDLVRVMAALIYGHASGANEAAGMQFGISYSFGYYKLLYALAPEHWLRDPDLAAWLINTVGLAAGVLSAWACALYLNRLVGVTAALCATTLLFLSPMMLPVAMSGHPLIPATVCLFFAGWFFAKADEQPSLRLAHWGAALVLLLFGLSLRAEIVLAFPFLWLARSRNASSPLTPRLLVGKALLLGAAFALFLYMQQAYVAAAGGAATRLMAFLKLFLSVSMLGRGIVVLVLAIGLATLVALGLALRSRALTRREVLMALALALPPAAFWLPNPQPARHFFFVVLAASLLAAVWVAKRTRNAAAAVVIALVVAIANQLAAEGVRPVIDSRYAWAYPSASPRRATQQAPLGAFPLDQRANQVQVALEREEALALVRRAPRELIVLGDFEYYIIAHLLAADRALRWTEEVRDGLVVHELRSAERRLVFIEKNSGWPRDVTAEILSRASWRDWPVYVQPTTISRYDRTEVPAARRYEVGLERRVQALRKQ